AALQEHPEKAARLQASTALAERAGAGVAGRRRASARPDGGAAASRWRRDRPGRRAGAVAGRGVGGGLRRLPALRQGAGPEEPRRLYRVLLLLGGARARRGRGLPRERARSRGRPRRRLRRPAHGLRDAAALRAGGGAGLPARPRPDPRAGGRTRARPAAGDTGDGSRRLRPGRRGGPGRQRRGPGGAPLRAGQHQRPRGRPRRRRAAAGRCAAGAAPLRAASGGTFTGRAGRPRPDARPDHPLRGHGHTAPRRPLPPAGQPPARPQARPRRRRLRVRPARAVAPVRRRRPRYPARLAGAGALPAEAGRGGREDLYLLHVPVDAGRRREPAGVVGGPQRGRGGRLQDETRPPRDPRRRAPQALEHGRAAADVQRAQGRDEPRRAEAVAGAGLLEDGRGGQAAARRRPWDDRVLADQRPEQPLLRGHGPPGPLLHGELVALFRPQDHPQD
ncbi:MAG: Undecaprenyl-phosphate glycophosphotransferase, partial [uncultured Rubrobacteraceae bacterium]